MQGLSGTMAIHDDDSEATFLTMQPLENPVMKFVHSQIHLQNKNVQNGRNIQM